MCIIAIKKAGYPLPDNSIFETMFTNNSDGAGFMYTYNGKVMIEKGYMTFKSFHEALKRVSETIDTYNTPMIFHFRISTHGGVNQALCHPFPLSKKVSNLKRLTASTTLGIVHNGIIPVEPRKGISDTMEYIISHLATRSKKNPYFYKNKKERKAILAEINNSKMAFLDSDGKIYTVGDFVSDNGILYSNTSYKERTFHFSMWDDYIKCISATPIDGGYIISGADFIECDFGEYYIDKCGRLYEYDYTFDIAYSIRGTAYDQYGMPMRYNERDSIYISVIR